MPSKATKLKAQTSQPMVEIIVERNESQRWREAQDVSQAPDMVFYSDCQEKTPRLVTETLQGRHT